MTRSYSSFMFWLGMVIMASAMLYHTSDRVNELDAELRTLNAQIATQQESLHVLKAEWVYLANPSRIQAEAVRHLNLQPTETKRVAALQNIAALLPVHNGLEPTPIETADATPASPALPPQAKPETHFKHVMASLGTTHINDHMTLTHSAALSSPDKIGAMIGTLGSLHP